MPKWRAPTGTGLKLALAMLLAAPATAVSQATVFPFDGDPGPGKLYVKADATPPTYVTGRSGQAIVFGDGSVVAMPLDIDARRHPQLTVSVWVKAGLQDPTRGWLFGPGDGNNQPYLRILAGRHVAVEGRYVSGDATGQLQSDATLPVDEWVLVAAVWDYDARTIKLFVGTDAEPVLFENLDMDTSTTSVGKQRLQTAPDAPAGSEAERFVFIGARNFNYASPVKHLAIDDLRIFMQALSDDQIIALGSATAAPDTSVVTVADNTGETDGTGGTDETGAQGVAPTSACAAHSDCATGTYCARDLTCHPNIHLPVDAFPEPSGTATGGTATTPDGSGRFALSWSILNTHGDALSCAAAGADRVSVLATPFGKGRAHDTILDCESGTGLTDPLPIGQYTLSVSLLESETGAPIGTARPVVGTLDVDGETGDLGLVALATGIGVAGNVSFSINFGMPGGNCFEGLLTGEPVLQQRVTLRDSTTGQCVDAPLHIDGVTYETICANLSGCAESDEHQVLEEVPAGNYEFEVEGVVDDGDGPVSCFLTTIPLSVDGDVDIGAISVPAYDGNDELRRFRCSNL